MRIKIVEPGLEKFSDVMAGVKFEDGVSVEPVAIAIRNRIAACIRVEEYGHSGVQVGPSADMIRINEIEAEKRKKYARGSDEVSEVKPVVEPAEEAVENEEPIDDEADSLYTIEELEAIGAEDGIKGLRKIGDKLNVKGTSITALIEAILEAQNK